MIFKRPNRTDAEQVFIVVRNTEGSTLNANDVVQWATHSASVDGVGVRQPDTGHDGSIVGILDAAIANAAYGLVQIFGYRSTSRVFQTNTSQDTGQFLEASIGAAHLSSYASTIASNTTVTLKPGPYFILAESIASSAASATISAKLFIRCM